MGIENEKVTKDKKGFYRKNISKLFHNFFEEAEAELAKLKVEADFVEFTDYVCKFLPADLAAQFVEAHTPLESKLALAMNDPELREALAKIIDKHSKVRK